MAQTKLWRIAARIDSIKKDMGREKAMFGCIRDGRGLRYEVPFLQMRLMDLTGALRYRTWFLKNFPDDIGEPLGRYAIWYGSNCEEPEWLADYDFASLEFVDAAFTSWLREEYHGEAVQKAIERFVGLGSRLKDEYDVERRGSIIGELQEMRYGKKFS